MKKGLTRLQREAIDRKAMSAITGIINTYDKSANLQREIIRMAMEAYICGITDGLNSLKELMRGGEEE